MRRIFTFCAALISLSASAQLQKGTWSVSTSTNAPFNLNFRSNGPGYKSSSLTINPMAGYAVSNRWEVGGGPIVDFSSALYKDPSGNTGFRTHSISYGINLYTRYYLSKQGALRPYLTAAAGWMQTRGESFDASTGNSIFRYQQKTISAGAGLSWFISPRTALFSELKYTGNWGSNGVGYTKGLQLNVGFQFYFGRKKKK